MSCFEDIADEVIVAGKDIPYEFEWTIWNKEFQRAFDEASGDWVIRMDIDYFIHEKDIKFKE